MRANKIIWILVLLILVEVATADVLIPTFVSFQGKLANNTNGNPYTNVSVRINITNLGNLSSVVWGNFNYANITDSNGVFSIVLGKTNQLNLTPGKDYNLQAAFDLNHAQFTSANVIFGDRNPSGDEIIVNSGGPSDAGELVMIDNSTTVQLELQKYATLANGTNFTGSVNISNSLIVFQNLTVLGNLNVSSNLTLTKYLGCTLQTDSTGALVCASQSSIDTFNTTAQILANVLVPYYYLNTTEILKYNFINSTSGTGNSSEQIATNVLIPRQYINQTELLRFGFLNTSIPDNYVNTSGDIMTGQLNIYSNLNVTYGLNVSNMTILENLTLKKFTTCTLKTDGSGILTCGTDIDTDTDTFNTTAQILANVLVPYYYLNTTEILKYNFLNTSIPDNYVNTTGDIMTGLLEIYSNLNVSRNLNVSNVTILENLTFKKFTTCTLKTDSSGILTCGTDIDTDTDTFNTSQQIVSNVLVPGGYLNGTNEKITQNMTAMIRSLTNSSGFTNGSSINTSYLRTTDTLNTSINKNPEILYGLYLLANNTKVAVAAFCSGSVATACSVYVDDPVNCAAACGCNYVGPACEGTHQCSSCSSSNTCTSDIDGLCSWNNAVNKGNTTALYGSATGGTLNYAGYFDAGDVYIKNNLQLNNYQTCTLKTSSNGSLTCGDQSGFTNGTSITTGFLHVGDGLNLTGRIISNGNVSITDDTNISNNLWIENGLIGPIGNVSIKDSLNVTDDVFIPQGSLCIGSSGCTMSSVNGEINTTGNVGVGSYLNVGGDLDVEGGDIDTATLRFGTTTSSGQFEFEDAGVCIGDGGCTASAVDGELNVSSNARVVGEFRVGGDTHVAGATVLGTALDGGAALAAGDLNMSGDLYTGGALILGSNYTKGPLKRGDLNMSGSLYTENSILLGSAANGGLGKGDLNMSGFIYSDDNTSIIGGLNITGSIYLGADRTVKVTSPADYYAWHYQYGYEIGLAADANYQGRFWMDPVTGATLFLGGGGASGTDVKLYRSAAGTLRTNGSLTIDADLDVTGSDITTGTLRFGTTSTSGLFEFEDAGVCIGDGGCTASATDGTLQVNTGLCVGSACTVPTTAGRALFAGAIAVGGALTQAYNQFGSGTTGSGAMNAGGDVYITGELEVDSTAYLAGGTAWTIGDIAENIETKESRENKICNGNVSCYKENTNDNIDFGDLVCIDPSDARTIMKCNEANSKLAVGIITNTSVLFVGPDTGYPVSLAGLAYSHVTNESGNINPGDLLVSSSIPGYAMRNDNPKDGTVVGKAFDFCDNEKCTIPVFVALS